MDATHWNKQIDDKERLMFWLQDFTARSCHTWFSARSASRLLFVACCCRTPDTANFRTSSARSNPSEGMCEIWNQLRWNLVTLIRLCRPLAWGAGWHQPFQSQRCWPQRMQKCFRLNWMIACSPDLVSDSSACSLVLLKLPLLLSKGNSYSPGAYDWRL